MAASGSTRKRGRYLLHTNIVTALFKQDAGVRAEVAAAKGPAVLYRSRIELYYGATRSGPKSDSRPSMTFQKTWQLSLRPKDSAISHLWHLE